MTGVQLVVSGFGVVIPADPCSMRAADGGAYLAVVPATRLQGVWCRGKFRCRNGSIIDQMSA